MEIKTTNVYARTLDAIIRGKRLIVNCGGTSSSKTYSIVQLLINIALVCTVPLMISMVSESFPHLRRGLIRDFKNILAESFDDDRWSKTESIYDFGKAQMEFFSADDASKLRGGRRDILFINEANNNSKEAFDELDVRTRRFTIIDFNPVSEFWAHEKEHDPEVEWIHSTYKDAIDVLDASTIANIESRKDRDPAWWRVYGMGLVGRIEGLCHPSFTQCDELPENFDREIYGLDFGYSMDPAALVLSRIVGETIYSKQLIYEKSMTNDQIAKRFETLNIRKGYDIIIADSAEPKSIDEIKAYGYDIRPCVKGPDSVNSGIQKVNQFRQVWTKDSLDAIKEQRNYRYEKDKNGKFTNKPIDDWDHLMSCRRYSIATIPAPKVIPTAQTGIMSEFKIDFQNLSEYSTLVTSIWVEKNLKTYAIFALWNAREKKFWVFGEISMDHPQPDIFIVKAALYLSSITDKEIKNLNKFEVWGNDFMHRPTEKDEFNDMATAYSKYDIWVRENMDYVESGAILQLSRLIQRKGVKIHRRCEKTSIECASWSTEKGSPDKGYAYARAVCNAVSACWEASSFDPPPQKLKPFSEESQRRRKELTALIKTNPTAFDVGDEEELVTGKDDNKTGWMS